MHTVLIGAKVPADMKDQFDELAWKRRSTTSKEIKKLIERELAKDRENEL